MKITPYTIVKGIRYLRHYGWKDFWIRLTERMEPEEVAYTTWLETYRLKPTELMWQRKEQEAWEKRPLISIVVPAFQTSESFLHQMIESVMAQTYDNWELCIADGSTDDRLKAVIESYFNASADVCANSHIGSIDEQKIRYVHLPRNQGIAQNTNEALKMANGQWIAFLDHDDLLAENALYEVAKAIRKDDAIDIVYTDEDKVSTDLREYFQPHLKPDFSLDLLRSNNYITHFLIVKKSIVEQVGGFLTEFDGAQDYDFIFRCSEVAKRIYHVPEILYHWRAHKASTADNPASKGYAVRAGQCAIEAHLERCSCKAVVSATKDFGFYRVTYTVVQNPKVSIIIPNKDEVETLKKCLHSIEKSTYTNYEILIIENNSKEERTFAYYEEQKKNKNLDIRVLTWEKPFNYSAINNYGVENAVGEYLILLNNDIEIINFSWIEELLGNCQRKEVGIVGGKLYFPDDTIQHAGTVIGIGGIAGHVFVGMKRTHSGYFHKASIQLNYSAVTAACMMVKRAVYDEVGGMEETLAIAFNDVDFCLRVCNKGYLIVYNPYVECYHYESKSRGKEDSKEKAKRFQREIEFMRTRWIDVLKSGDPYYNKNLTLSKWNYSLSNRELHPTR
ncbi:glycosyltransferase family 2 protein [Lachnospiraceae bacterium ZAX-1]